MSIIGGTPIPGSHIRLNKAIGEALPGLGPLDQLRMPVTPFSYMTGYGHTEFLKSLVTTYNPQEHAKTPILSYTPEYRTLPKLNIPLSCSNFY